MQLTPQPIHECLSCGGSRIVHVNRLYTPTYGGPLTVSGPARCRHCRPRTQLAKRSTAHG